ncbi:UDP-N-acetylmuramate dehydrogenase [Clostridium sp. 'deep sea']|uniref:UDP-N-acetylmuramate dehydrogenase n=1 Tax=Clostridium sp. 'deep sea' TaxID=2779445 RepID=UPI0018963FD8|nr:UDP-N-acetylmuramate dehydrogenase [Clostridium sp. 'deep sea']QOR34004.1 UDP-N-acetylmuramate dehydrogenase [Clostridium sp. 'deep sea']
MDLMLWQQQLKDNLHLQQVEFNVDMCNYTYFKIGGPADAFITLNNEYELQKIKKFAQKNKLTLTIIGNGTNLLVSDKGIRGIVVKIGDNLQKISAEGCFIIAESGALLSQVAQVALANSLTGFEFASGIPGSIGGAVFMNAGAYDGEMSQIVSRCWVVTNEGNYEEWDSKRLNLRYRNSAVATEKAIITKVEIKLKQGEKSKIKAEMNKLNRWRRERQPLAMPSAGSTFKRPPDVAGSYLIDQAGLKGYSIGGAQVSTKHAGFVINVGGATAQNVLDVMAHIQKTVYEKFNILLEPEVRLLGEEMKSDLITKN